ncbi:MAG: hypothetical protein DVB23_000336 [Verrucomicrobia bacterium]|nr:MAG: hypothetical protein DVB23_000336 [Verrucomicrobiota bacterium]
MRVLKSIYAIHLPSPPPTRLPALAIPRRAQRQCKVAKPHLDRRSQVVHHAWVPFLAEYETVHRKTYGPLRPDAVAVVDQFYKCGDLAAGFTRLQCPDCGHEKLLTCIRLETADRRLELPHVSPAS